MGDKLDQKMIREVVTRTKSGQSVIDKSIWNVGVLSAVRDLIKDLAKWDDKQEGEAINRTECKDSDLPDKLNRGED